MNELQVDSFNYKQLDTNTADFLKHKENNMREIIGHAYTELGRELKEAQNKLAGNNQYNGIFEEWFTSLGFKKTYVYKLINRYELVHNVNDQQKELLEELPVSLTYEIAKPSADEGLKQKVLDGDVTTLKEYKQLEKEKKKAEERAKQAEAEAEQARRGEEIALKHLEEAEVDKHRLGQLLTEERNKEPKVITKEVVVESDNKELERQIKFKEKEISSLKAELNMMKQQQTFNENESEKELKYLDYQANKTVLTLKLQIDNFLKEAAITAFRKGAIAASSQSTKHKIEQGIEELEDFCSEVRLALKGRIELTKKGGSNNA